MAITKEILHATDRNWLSSSDATAWLESKLCPTYADSVVYNEESSTNDVFKGEQKIFSFGTYNVSGTIRPKYTAFFKSGVTIEKSDSINTSAAVHGFTTSNGVCVALVRSDNIMDRVLFALDQNGNTLVIIQDSFGQANNISFNAAKTDENVVTAPTAINTGNPVQFSTTVLASFPAFTASGEASYTPNAFFGITKEYSGVWSKKATINGDEYLLLDGWYLKD